MAFLVEALEENMFPCLFQFLEASYISWDLHFVKAEKLTNLERWVEPFSHDIILMSFHLDKPVPVFCIHLRGLLWLHRSYPGKIVSLSTDPVCSHLCKSILTMWGSIFPSFLGTGLRDSGGIFFPASITLMTLVSIEIS